MREFKVSARVYRAFDHFFDTSVKVEARDEGHAEKLADYEIAAANKGKQVTFIEIRSVETLGEDEALRRMGAEELPLVYEV